MEIKKIKTKAKARAKINNIVENHNADALIENDESIFIQKVETQNDLLDLSNNDVRDTTKDSGKLLLAYLPWVLLVILLLSSSYLWFQLSDIKNDPLKAAKAETAEIINLVGKIIVLPKDESPKIATLTEDDLSKIKSQSFFINAKVGDKVLVYTIARKVILYSPNLNKIVEVANLNSDNSSLLQPSL
jgi:hypothetical protein